MPKKLKLIPVSVVIGAMNAEPDAIQYVLTYFGGYINRLSTRKQCDAYGNEYVYMDEDIKTRLEAKLICSIINKFELQIII